MSSRSTSVGKITLRELTLLALLAALMLATQVAMASLPNIHLVGVLVILSALLFGWNCPIKYLTGVPCPGCGLSRALAALLRLDFRTALRFHPMVFVLPPVVLYALFGKKPLLGSKNLERMLLWSVIVLDIAIWLIRLALHDPLIF